MTMKAMILYLFNHQTHYRGRVTILLMQNGIDDGITDLLETFPTIKFNSPATYFEI
ncbi:MAG: DinB family protein [Gammaproteobacteria bacterium]